MLDISIKKKQGILGLDICFLSPKNGVTALFGKSGAGKTKELLNPPELEPFTKHFKCPDSFDFLS